MDKMKKMKKKLFIGGAYLVVALLLLIYVSYSAYRIKYTATVEMPEALEQRASLTIDLYSQATGKANDTNEIVLTNLMPNENVKEYASDSQLASERGRVITFSVSNADLINATANELGDPSKLEMDFKIRLIETGTVPISCILINNEDPDATAYTLSTSDKYEKRSNVFRKYLGEKKYMDAVFHLGNNTQQTLHFTMYVGWNNNNGAFDGSDRKEIATIEIKPEITQSVPISPTPANTGKTLKQHYAHYALSTYSEIGKYYD